MRRAFTILEVLVMSAIALVILAVAWSVFSAMTRQSKKLDTRLRALQASQLVIERLKADLKMHVQAQPRLTIVDPAEPALALKIFRDYAYNPASDSQACIAVDSIRWVFNPSSHYLIRGTEQLKFAQFESVRFSVIETPEGSREYGNAVRIDGTYVPEELLATPDRITDNDRIHWSATVGLPYRTLQDAYGFWHENVFDKTAP